MNDQERRRGLFTLGRSMSAADLSILHAALGWMTEAGRLDAAPGTKLFEIRSAAKEFIAQFLADLDQPGAMTRIVNELRAQIPIRLIDAVREVDGTPADLAILVAGIVESTMRKALKPELHDEFLREVAKVAEAMRST